MLNDWILMAKSVWTKEKKGSGECINRMKKRKTQKIFDLTKGKNNVFWTNKNKSKTQILSVSRNFDMKFNEWKKKVFAFWNFTTKFKYKWKGFVFWNFVFFLKRKMGLPFEGSKKNRSISGNPFCAHLSVEAFVENPFLFSVEVFLGKIVLNQLFTILFTHVFPIFCFFLHIFGISRFLRVFSLRFFEHGLRFFSSHSGNPKSIPFAVSGPSADESTDRSADDGPTMKAWFSNELKRFSHLAPIVTLEVSKVWVWVKLKWFLTFFLWILCLSLCVSCIDGARKI